MHITLSDKTFPPFYPHGAWVPTATKQSIKFIKSYPRISGTITAYLIEISIYLSDLYILLFNYRVFNNEWYKSFCLFLRLWCIFRSKTCGKLLLTFGHFGDYRLKVLVENLCFWFSPGFKIVKFIDPAENTKKS